MSERESVKLVEALGQPGEPGGGPPAPLTPGVMLEEVVGAPSLDQDADGLDDDGAEHGVASEDRRNAGLDEAVPAAEPAPARLPGVRGRGRRKGRRTVAPEVAEATGKAQFRPEERVLILDTWLRSGLPASDFSPLVGASTATLYDWKRRFEAHGPAGLDARARGPAGSRLPEATRRAILMTKKLHPDWGSERIHHQMGRSDGLSASPGAIQRVLVEEGYVVEQVEAAKHDPPVHRFERSKPNELWQSDLFTFVLRRQNRRVHLVAFLDDYSRFVTSFGLHATASGALVREVFLAGIARYGAPVEVLTDNGTQYRTWRGKSQFTQLCEQRGIRHIVASPRRPQTLGKAERAWGTLWRELLETAVFRDLDEARERVGWFFDHYNFQRTHQGIDGLVPADRFFSAAPEVAETLRRRVAANALDLAQHGAPRKPFYLTGRVGDVGLVTLHAEGDRVILVGEDGIRQEVDLSAPGRRAELGGPASSPLPVTDHAAPPDHPATLVGEPTPGTSPLDGALERGVASLDPRASSAATTTSTEEPSR